MKKKQLKEENEIIEVALNESVLDLKVIWNLSSHNKAPLVHLEHNEKERRTFKYKS